MVLATTSWNTQVVSSKSNEEVAVELNDRQTGKLNIRFTILVEDKVMYLHIILEGLLKYAFYSQLGVNWICPAIPSPLYTLNKKKQQQFVQHFKRLYLK